LGDPSKAEKYLGWKRECGFDQLVHRMASNDLELAKKELQNA
jgi:GDPmannose 4,6-dehydratase